MTDYEIEEIKVQLLDFEVSYRIGSWENFQKRRPKPSLRSRFSIAFKYAALWLFLLFVPYVLNDTISLMMGIKRLAVTNPGHTQTKDALSYERSNRSLNTQKFIAQEQSLGMKIEMPSMAILFATPTVSTIISNHINTAQPQLQLGKLTLPGTSRTKDKFLDFLENESNNSSLIVSSASEKRKIIYALSIGASQDFRLANKMNFEAGLAYTFNESLSVYSGISYGSFGALKHLIEPQGSQRTRSSLQADLMGLSIPLEMEYRPNEKTFLRSGLSASLMAKRSASLTYNEKINSFQNFADEQGHTQIREVITEKFMSEEVSSEEILSAKSMLFYHFSAGYRLPLFASTRIAVEPYVKVPLAAYGIYRLNLFQGGLKFRVDF